jgi:hypothetical protein
MARKEKELGVMHPLSTPCVTKNMKMGFPDEPFVSKTHFYFSGKRLRPSEKKEKKDQNTPKEKYQELQDNPWGPTQLSHTLHKTTQNSP